MYKRLLRAHLNLEQAHEYLRHRLQKIMYTEAWTFYDLFRVVEDPERHSIGVYDLEKMIIEHKRGGSRNLVTDIQLLIEMYDRCGCQRISSADFEHQLVPRLSV